MLIRATHRAVILAVSALALNGCLVSRSAAEQTASDVQVFADFESGTFDGWTLTGNCWTREPHSAGTIEGITGFQGKRFLCTLHPRLGGSATGKAVSREFTVQRTLITFLIGGGNHPGPTCMNLVVDGKVVRTQTGDDSAELKPAEWNVADLVGKRATLEVVDTSQSSDRGYIMVDCIRFEDDLPTALVSTDVSAACQAAHEFLAQGARAPATARERWAVDTFRKCGVAVGVPGAGMADPLVADHGAWICVLSARYRYTLDCTGVWAFEPVSNVPAMVAALAEARAPAASVTREQLVARARAIATAAGVSLPVNTGAFGKREVLFACKCGKGVSMTSGGYLVRLAVPSDPAYFEVAFGPRGTPVGFRSSMPLPRMPSEPAPSHRGSLGTPFRSTSGRVTLGSFYSTQEQRFLDSVASFERYSLGDISFVDSPTAVASASSVVVVRRVPLSSFGLIGVTRPGGHLRIDQSFYDGIEACTVAVIATHGGPVNGVFQLDQGLGPDTWFAAGHPQNRFGRGELRHLIFQACAATSYFAAESPDRRCLTLEWMRATTVIGLRTVCGFDGNGSSDGRNGTVFLHHYLQGASISTAWLWGTMDENNGDTLHPVTLAYGSTPQDAVVALADGRFAAGGPVTPNYCLASVWTDF